MSVVKESIGLKKKGEGGGGNKKITHTFRRLSYVYCELKHQMNYKLNFEYNDRRNKIIPKEVQAKHPRASSVTNTSKLN